MKPDTTADTMIDIAHVPGNKVSADSYRITLSRGGVNGDTDRSVVTVEADGLESFLGRAQGLLSKTIKPKG